MQQDTMKTLWKQYDDQLESHLQVNSNQIKTTITKNIRGLLFSMTPIKLFTLIVGIVWVLGLDWLIINTINFASTFFLVSAILQVLITKIALVFYFYQLLLMSQVNVAEPIITTQQLLAKLQASTLWCGKILILQLPLWTTFYLNEQMFQWSNTPLLIVQALITASFTLISFWFFVQIRIQNKDKKWFKILFTGKEWTPLLQAIELLQQSETYIIESGQLH